MELSGTHVARFDIKAFQLDSAIESVAASNKIARRLHCPEMTLEVVREWTVKHKTLSGSTVLVNWVEIKIEGPAPKLAGWTLLAVLEGLGDEALLQVVPGLELDALKWGKADPRFCDHCRKKRRRNETFIVRHEDGREMQVGRNCLADFLGHQGAQNLLKLWNSLSFGEPEEGMFGGGFYRNTGAIELHELLSLTSVMVSLWGWASRGTAEEKGIQATADTVTDFLTGRGRFDMHGLGQGYRGDIARAEAREQQDKVRAAVTTVNADEIQAAIEWAATCTDTGNSYLHNIGVIARAGCCNKFKQYGFGCSILTTYRRNLERDEEKAARLAAQAERPESHHFGEIKKREVFTLTIKRLIESESDWGSTLLHIMEDQDGNEAKWFCSGRSLMVADPAGKFSKDGYTRDRDGVEAAGFRPATEGDTVQVKATVKCHSEYKGQKQTMLTRVVGA